MKKSTPKLTRLIDGKWSEELKPPKNLSNEPKILAVPESMDETPGFLREDAEGDIEFKVLTKDDEAERTAKRLTDLIVKDKLTPGEAAKKAGVPLNLMPPDIRERAAALLEKASFAPQVRKSLIRAGLLHMALENMQAEDPASKRIALEAFVKAGQDPEVGVIGPQTQVGVGVNVDLSSLKGVFDNVTESEGNPFDEEER